MEVLMRTALTNALSASMLAMAVAAVGLVLTRRPAVLHCLWLIVLVKLLAPPILEVPLIDPLLYDAPGEGAAAERLLLCIEESEPSADVAPSIVLAEPMATDATFEVVAEEAVEESAPWIEPGTLWASLGAAWLVGSLATAGLAAVRVRRFQRVLRDADPAEPEVEEEVATLAGVMGIRRPPGVVFVEGRLTPLLWAVGRPRLVIPWGLWKSLDARSRRMLVTHELAHLRRGDHWLRFFELAVTVAYWWLPLVWWVRRALRDVEEQCCDAWVVWMFPDHARTYAETLLDTVDFLNPVAKPEPLLASGFGKVQHLRKRLTMVMLGTTPRTLGWSGTLGALALAGLLLPMSPTWAQKADAVDVKSTSEDVSVTTAAEGENVTLTTTDAGDVFTASPSEVFIAELDDPNSDDAIKTEDVFVVVDDSDSSDKRSQAVQKAVDELNARIEELASKPKDEKSGDAEERDEHRIQALKSAIERLRKHEKDLGQVKVDGQTVDVKPGHRLVVTRRGQVVTDNVVGPTFTVRDRHGKSDQLTVVSEDGKTITAKAVVLPDGKTTLDKEIVLEGKDGKLKADSLSLKLNPKGNPKEIEAARRRVEELNRELKTKQKELLDAHQKLAELQGLTVGRPGALTLKPVRVPSVSRTGPIRVERSVKLEPRDDARLDSLEKKLSKVLDELESLKKAKDVKDQQK